jgi:hypothetical protein
MDSRPLVQVTVDVRVAVKRYDGMFLAKCPLLNVLSQGASEQDAISNLMEELGFLFQCCSSPDALTALLDNRISATREPFSREDVVRVEHLNVANVPPEVLNRFADASISVL